MDNKSEECPSQVENENISVNVSGAYDKYYFKNRKCGCRKPT